MMVIEIFLIALLIFMLLGALIAVETKNLLSSVISLGAVGFGMSIAFLFLMAPDLAIVQIAVEVILLVFLIRATISREIKPIRAPVSVAFTLLPALLCAGLLLFGIFAFGYLPLFGYPVMESLKEPVSTHYLANGLKETGAANIVSSVILDYRAFDTLGEATVLFTALLGALAVLRSRAWTKGKKK